MSLVDTSLWVSRKNYSIYKLLKCMENVSTFYNIISMAPTYILSILDDLDIRYSRSSGAGGQNVNKGLYTISHPL